MAPRLGDSPTLDWSGKIVSAVEPTGVVVTRPDFLWKNA